jgi:hypothetical protein
VPWNPKEVDWPTASEPLKSTFEAVTTLPDVDSFALHEPVIPGASGKVSFTVHAEIDDGPLLAILTFRTYPLLQVSAPTAHVVAALAGRAGAMISALAVVANAATQATRGIFRDRFI